MMSRIDEVLRDYAASYWLKEALLYAAVEK
jgi:hypothetical protein